jgi:hypothetical protein
MYSAERSAPVFVSIAVIVGSTIRRLDLAPARRCRQRKRRLHSSRQDIYLVAICRRDFSFRGHPAEAWTTITAIRTKKVGLSKNSLYWRLDILQGKRRTNTGLTTLPNFDG